MHVFLKSLLFATCFSICLGSFSVVAGDDFEGIITYNLETERGNVTDKKDNLTFHIKDQKVLIRVKDESSDVSKGGAKVLIDLEREKYITLMEKDGEKVAMTFGLDEFKEMMQKVSEKKPESSQKEDVQVEVSDDTKEIDGYSCQKVVVQRGEHESEAWITQEINLNFHKLFPIFKTTKRWKQYADAYDGFVMAVENSSNKERQQYSYTASVKEKSLDSELFQIPADYKEMDMGKMMEQFKQANPEVYETMLQQLQH